MILIKLFVDEDSPKEIKKKIEEYKYCERTIHCHNEFLMFLMNKKVKYMREMQSTSAEV